MSDTHDGCVPRAEYERLRDATDAIHADLLRLAADLYAQTRAEPLPPFEES